MVSRFAASFASMVIRYAGSPVERSALRPLLSAMLLPLIALFVVALPIGSAQAQAAEAELLRNGSFEGGSGPDGRGGGAPRWQPYEAGYDIDRSVHHGGDQAIRCDNLRVTTQRGAHCSVELNQREAAPIIVTGWSRAESVSGLADAHYSLYVDLVYMDGTPLYGQASPFKTGTHGWERARVTVFPAKPVKSMTVYALFRNHSGTAWFDDFSAHVLDGPGIFDGQVYAMPARPANSKPAVVVNGRDGLSLGFDSRAAVVQTSVAGRSIVGKRAGGFFLRDVAKDGEIVAAQGKANPYHGTGLDFFSSPGGMGIRFYARITPNGNSLDVDGELTDVTKSDRAITVYLTLPVAPDGMRWDDDIRRSKAISAQREYANLVPVNVGATGSLSLYPFGCIFNDQVGIGIASQMDWPSVYRIFYNAAAGQMVIAWDVALTGKTAAWPSHNARFRCTLFSLSGAEAKWGFRAAADRFYRLNSSAYDRRAKAEGIWIPFTDPSKIPGYADFSIAYHEGDNSVKTDNHAGILSFRYTEPMSWWMNMPKEMPRTYENAVSLARKIADDPSPANATERDLARAVFNSGSQDQNGRFNLEFRKEPWGDGAVFLFNPNPELPSGKDRPTRASVAYTVADAIRRFSKENTAEHGALDGEYLDSLESWADVLDFRPSHLQASPYPIPFDTQNHAPAMPQWYSTHTFARFLRDDLHNRGKLLMANAVPIRFSIFSAVLDVMGIEVNWLSPEGAYRPESDDVLSLRRTLSYRKPYLLLQNTNFDKFDSDMMRKYFERCLFYGIYPSAFSADAATYNYWDTPRWRERDRALFRKYIPIIKLLSAAGWAPITHAVSDNPKIYVERFGTEYLTLMNDSNETQTTLLKIDKRALRATGSAHSAVDLVGGSVFHLEADGERLSVALRPLQSMCLKIQ